MAFGEKGIRSFGWEATAHFGTRGCNPAQLSPQFPHLLWGFSQLPRPLSHPETPRSARAASLEEEKEEGAFRGWDANPAGGRCLHSCRQPPYPQSVNGYITPSHPPASAPETVGPNERKEGRAAVCIIHMHGEVYIYPHVPPHPAAAAIPYASRVSGHERSGCSQPLGLLSFQPLLPSPRPQPSLDPF